MRRSQRFTTFCCLLAAVACFPEEKSNQVQVAVTPSTRLSTLGIIEQGRRDTVFAHAYRVAAAGDTQPIVNADFSWSSTNSTVATVAGLPNGAAEVTGLSAGYTGITATAVAFEGSSTGTVQVRVSPSFAIDSLRPDTVRYGQLLSVFGVGVNKLFVLNLGFGDLIRDYTSFAGSPDGLASESWWVPFPASSDLPFYIGPGFFGSTNDSVIVLPEDIYEFNDTIPAVIDANGETNYIFSGLPAFFYNPALYFEPYGFFTEWYRFEHADMTSDVTVMLRPNVFSDTAFSYLMDSVEQQNGGFYFPGDLTGGAGLGFIASPGLFTYCDNHMIFSGVPQPAPIWALRGLTDPQLQVLSFFAREGGYTLMMLHGYLTQDPRLGPDRFEEDDIFCRQSYNNFATSNDSTTANARHIVVGAAAAGRNGPWFDSTLTIDNPGDLDVIGFRLQAPVVAADTFLTINTKSRPFGAFDPSDIDVYLMDSSFNFLAGSFNVGSAEHIQVHGLPPGLYYLAVTDQAQQGTRYAVCVTKFLACLPPGSAPRAQMTASVLALPPRVPHDPTVPPPGFDGRRLPSPRR